MDERMDTQDFVDIPGAARELTKCGIRVLLDASDNSLPKEAINTERERVLELDVMTRESS